MTIDTPAVVNRARSFVGLSGPDALAFLDRMVSNDVAALSTGGSCQALLLTPKGRVIAPLVVVRRAGDDFLLLTEQELGGAVRDALWRSRLAARVEITLEEHRSHVLLGRGLDPPAGLAVPNAEFGLPGLEVIDGDLPDQGALSDAEAERLRIEAATPRFGSEIDERVLPAEAGIVEQFVSFTKGCYPGQEPIARLHYRGHANRGLRLLRIEAEAPPEADAELVCDGKVVGRITSAVAREDDVVALAYVRVEVPDGAPLQVGGAPATMISPRRP